MKKLFAFKSITLRLFITFSFLLDLSYSEPGYLKFCGDENKNAVQSTSCSKGLWLNVPIKPGCVCAKGVWVLSDGFCDKKTAVIVGEDHCFHVGFNVRAVKFIGNPMDPFAPSIYTAPSAIDEINEIPENGFSPEIESDSSLLIGINPRRTVFRGDKLTCVQLQESAKLKPVHIYVNPGRSNSKWQFGTKAKCSSPVGYTHHLGFGEMFQDSKIHSKDFIGRSCQDKCPVLKEIKGRSNKISKLKAGRVGRTFQRNKTRVIMPMKTPEELEEEANEERAKVMEDVDDYHRQINEQTLRMMQAQISPILLNFPNNQINSREYQYVQKVRLVTKALCPEEYVPDNLVDGLMRMFKQLLFESVNHDRPHNEGGDDDQFNRTMAMLDLCTENVTQVNSTFHYYNYTGSYNFTDKTDASPDWPKPEQCPEPLIYGIFGKSRSGEFTVLHNATNGFHPYLKFNETLVDFVIETAWKIISIGHYHCSTSFNDSSAGDFAHFFHQMELFFNDKIIKRWYDPINVENTYKIVKLIFPNYDLKKFAFGLDLCLFGAQQYTDYGYNSKWIQRPKIPFTANELSQNKYIIPGLNNVSISTNDYAPKIDRRKKRDASMWGGTAQCMETYMDPVNIFGYSPKPGCQISKSG